MSFHYSALTFFFSDYYLLLHSFQVKELVLDTALYTEPLFCASLSSSYYANINDHDLKKKVVPLSSFGFKIISICYKHCEIFYADNHREKVFLKGTQNSII